MTYAAVFLTGLGGLLIEIVLVRRYGLLLGNTSEAAAGVISVYLLGLGMGGLLVVRALPRVRRPLRAAAWVYAAVGLLSLALDLWLRRSDPLSPVAGALWVLVIPGLPTVLMGLAFPLVFAAIEPGAHRWRVGGLVGANLAGSLAGTALGGNLALAELGLRASFAIGAAAYGAGAAALLVADARTRPVVPAAALPERLPWRADLALAAAVAGALVMGLEIFLLRRMPFFLQGFQPTLSGVLASCLLALTVGSALGTGILARLLRERAVAAALALAVLAICLGLHENAVPGLARLPIGSELGIHARIWLCTLVAAGLPCLFLGAVVPLCVSRFEDPQVRAVQAGRLFCFQGVGSVVGSLLVSQAFPRLWPHAYFAVALPALCLLAIAALGRTLGVRAAAGLAVAVAGASLLGWAGAGTPLRPEPPLVAAQRLPLGAARYLEHRVDAVTSASVVYDRQNHSIALYTEHFRATETGPGTGYMKVLGHLPFVLREGLSRVAVIAFGTGTTAEAVTMWPDPEEIDLVEISPAVIALAGHFAGDGPLAEPRRPAFLDDPRVRIRVTDGRRYLALREPGSLDLVTMEPLLPYAPGTVPLYTREFYALADRALDDDGILMQWLPTHALPPEYFETLLLTFARSFEHTSVWLVDRATLLVGSRTPHLPAAETLAARVEGAPEAVRLSLHEAGLARGVDFLTAFVGDAVEPVVADAEVLHDDRPFLERIGMWNYDARIALRLLGQNLARLADLAEADPDAPGGEDLAALRVRRLWGLRHLANAADPRGRLENARRAAALLARTREVRPESVLLHAEETRARRALVESQVVRTRGRDGARGAAARHLARDPDSALLWAVLGLPGPEGGPPALAPAVAAERAVAVDPLFFRGAPPFLRHLSPPRGRHKSPLERVEAVPVGASLAEAVARDDALAVALRAAYPVRSAWSLLGVLERRPLDAAELDALANVLDPAIAARAVRAVARRGGDPAAELAPLWHDDLPALPSP